MSGTQNPGSPYNAEYYLMNSIPQPEGFMFTEAISPQHFYIRGAAMAAVASGTVGFGTNGTGNVGGIQWDDTADETDTIQLAFPACPCVIRNSPNLKIRLVLFTIFEGNNDDLKLDITPQVWSPEAGINALDGATVRGTVGAASDVALAVSYDISAQLSGAVLTVFGQANSSMELTIGPSEALGTNNSLLIRGGYWEYRRHITNPDISLR